MIRFDRLSSANIGVLNEILVSSAMRRTDLIRAAYLRRAQNFESTVEFLKELGCVRVADGQICIEPLYEEVLAASKEKDNARLKQFLVSRLVYSGSSVSRPIQEFLALFEGERELAPSNSDRLQFSAVRNFLIDLDFLQLDVQTRKYVIAPEYLLADRISRGKCSPRRLKGIMAAQERLGRAAELAVIEFERRRLAQAPMLAQKIEHVADSDTAAGFDIRSFDLGPSASNDQRERFIEVKAVSPREISFFLTRNEIETAFRLRRRYFLYLLPVAGHLKFDIEGLRIINDPASNVIGNSSVWDETREVSLFREKRLDGRRLSRPS